MTAPNWFTVGYDDSSWLSGAAPLGLDATVGPPQPDIVTQIDFSGSQPTVNRFSEPAFFRRHFNFPTTTNGATLTIRHVFEDGGVVFLNGQIVYSNNAPAGPYTFTSRAPVSSADPAPVVGPFQLPLTGLVPGDNVIAVVVLQNGATSSDVVMALELDASIAAFSSGPPVINTQPQSQTVNERQSVTFTVAADGLQPVSYYWRKNGVNIPGAPNSASYTINATIPSDAGTYSVFLSNAVSTVTSAGATLTVIPDLTAPSFISAVADTNLTNILLTFSEPLDAANAQNLTHYAVNLTAGGGALGITSATLLNGSNVLLVTSPRTQSQNYTITLNGVTDTAQARNVATPASRSVLGGIIILAPDNSHIWRFNQTSNDLTATGWQNVGYDDTQAGWQSGLAGLSSFGEEASAGFELRTFTLLAQTNNGPTTIYFRTHFNFPGNTNGAVLQWAGVVDDGAVFYVNGVEAGRIRVTNNPVFFTNQASASAPETTNVFHQAEGPFVLNAHNLVPNGDNVLAVEVHQNGTGSSDVVLSVQLIADVQSFVATVTGPRLNISRNPTTGEITVSWSGAGILQQTSALQSSGTVWSDVPGNPNPYRFTPAAGSSMRYFTLRQ